MEKIATQEDSLFRAVGMLPNNFMRRLEKYQEVIAYTSEKGISAEVRKRSKDDTFGVGLKRAQKRMVVIDIDSSIESFSKFQDNFGANLSDRFWPKEKDSIMSQFFNDSLKIATGYAADTLTQQVSKTTSQLNKFRGEVLGTVGKAVNTKLQWISDAWGWGLKKIDEGVQWSIELAAKATVKSDWYKYLVEYNAANTPGKKFDPNELKTRHVGSKDPNQVTYNIYEDLKNRLAFSDNNFKLRNPKADTAFDESREGRIAEAASMDKDLEELYEWMKEALGERKEDLSVATTKNYGTSKEERNADADKSFGDSEMSRMPSPSGAGFGESSAHAPATDTVNFKPSEASKMAKINAELKTKLEKGAIKVFTATVNDKIKALASKARSLGDLAKAEAFEEAITYLADTLELLSHAKDEEVKDYDQLINVNEIKGIDDTADVESMDANQVAVDDPNGYVGSSPSLVQRLVYDKTTGRLVGMDKVIDTDGTYYAALTGIESMVYFDKGEMIVPLETETKGSYTGNEESLAAGDMNSGSTGFNPNLISIVRRLKLNSQGKLEETGRRLAQVRGEYTPGLDSIIGFKKFVKGKGFETVYVSKDEYEDLKEEQAVNKIISLLYQERSNSEESSGEDTQAQSESMLKGEQGAIPAISDEVKAAYLQQERGKLGNKLLTIAEELFARETYVKDNDVVSLIDANEIGCDVLNTAANLFAQTSLGQKSLATIDKYTNTSFITQAYLSGVSKLTGKLVGPKDLETPKFEGSLIDLERSISKDGEGDNVIANEDSILGSIQPVFRNFNYHGLLMTRKLTPAVILEQNDVALRLTGSEVHEATDDGSKYDTFGDLSYFERMDSRSEDGSKNVANSDYGIADLATNFRVNKTFVGGEIEYFKSGYYHFFFVKPDLNLTENHIHVMECEGYPRMCDVIPELSYDLRALEQTWQKGLFPPIMSKIDRSMAHPFFSYLLSNAIKSLSIPDYALESKEGFENMFGHRFSFGTTGRKSGYQNDFSINFYDTSDLLLLNIFKTWVKYIEIMYEGQADLLVNPMQTGNLDYLGALYYFVLEPDNQTIVHWGRYTGIYPTSVPFSTINMSVGSSDLPEFSVNFKSQWHEWNSLAVLQDFNFVMRGAGMYGRPRSSENSDSSVGNYFALGSITECKNPSINADVNLLGGATVSENRALVQYVDLTLTKGVKNGNSFNHNTPLLRPYKYVLTFDSAKDFATFNSSDDPIGANTYSTFMKGYASDISVGNIIEKEKEAKFQSTSVGTRAFEYKSSGTDNSGDDLDQQEANLNRDIAAKEAEIRNEGGTP